MISQRRGRGEQVTVPIVIESQGDENTIGFSLQRANAPNGPETSEVLTNPVVTLGSGAPPNSNLGTNPTQAPQSVGILVDTTNTYMAGTREIVTVTYTIPANATIGIYPITFTSNPVLQSVGGDGNLLPVTWVGGFVEVIPTTAAGADVSGHVLTPDGRGLRNAVVLLTAPDGTVRRATTSSFGFYRFKDVETGTSFVVGVQSKRYRFAPRVLQVVDTLTDVDFVAQE